MNCKPDALVLGTVRPIAGSLLVAGALFCLGLMSVHSQTVDANTALTYVIDGNSVTVTDCEESFSGALVIPSSYNGIDLREMKVWIKEMIANIPSSGEIKTVTGTEPPKLIKSRS